uniref:Uncharacterized protein n=1 Tax=Phytophthora fragariae TaxID=53985 RepID=A0A6A3DMB1_9STRA|nr:hypothetical protein PF009_g26663 [Phytophthora fragariae]
MSTVLVYTAFNAIIVSVPLRWQPLAALIAPIFKITQKNVLRRILHGKDDVVPEMTIFNIDISNAFFISSNIQREASVNTGILLILIDLLQMLISLCDLRLMLQSVKGIADKMEISTEEAVAVALTIATKYPELRDRRMRTESLYHSKAEIHFLPSHRRTSNKKTTTSGQRFTNKVQIAPSPVQNNVGDVLRSSTSHILPNARYVMEPGANSAVSIDRISSLERYLLLDKVLQIMFFTEFILLTEFIEVFTPVMLLPGDSLLLDQSSILPPV